MNASAWAMSGSSGAIRRAWDVAAPGSVIVHAVGRHDDPARGDGDLDQALIQDSLSNDDASFARLVERYESAVAGILWHFTRDRLVLEELVQDTFVEVFFSLRRFRKGALFFPWLRTVATRVGYRYWRRLRREKDHEALLAERHQAAPTKSPNDTEYVYRTLELLDPKDRLVLTLQYFEGCNTREIAERMGWTLPVVKVRAFRARKRLKALLLAGEGKGSVGLE